MTLNPSPWPSYVSFQASWWVQSVSTSLGQAPSCLSSEQEMGYPHSPLMVVWPGCWSHSPTDQSILKEATVSFNIFLIYKAIVHSVWKSYTCVMNDWVMEHFFPFNNKENVKIRCGNYFEKCFSIFWKSQACNFCTTQQFHSWVPTHPRHWKLIPMKGVASKYL